MTHRICALLLLLLAASWTLVWSCQFGFGTQNKLQHEMHVLHARSGPVETPVEMTLYFDYEVSPVSKDEITYYFFSVSVTNCSYTYDPNLNTNRAFQVKISSLEPVTEMYGNVTIYGIRWGFVRAFV
ncbi:uncharacterized protein LOC129723528 isoform X2 [Wyeomyia smithii]|uniref:uncharacterized protein LOC129723528 isoform X2 n=1 Tax=Wyeomyia smithii TaxID=174621 RepID=UPI0024681278|nr:uncharacterized protein LOC129723528 isoform X2 [Wyeomyia smithii]